MLGRGRKVLVKRCPLHKEQMNQEKLFRQRVQHEGCKLGASLGRFGAARRPVRLQLSREGSHRRHGQRSDWDQAAQGPADHGVVWIFTGVRYSQHETVAIKGDSS